MRIAKEYDVSYLREIVKSSYSFREVGRKLNVDGKTAKNIVLRYKIKHPHFRFGKTYDVMIGKTFGKLTILSIYGIKEKGKRTKYIAKCRCECGNEKDILVSSIKARRITSCTCDKSRYKKITGKNNKNFTGYEEIRGSWWKELKNKTKRRKINFSIDIQEAWDLFIKQDRKCALSKVTIRFGRVGKREEMTASLDRIDSTKGYIQGNIQWVHKAVNIMKSDLPNDIFIAFCNEISKNFNSLIDIKRLENNHFMCRIKEKEKRLLRYRG